MCLLVCFPDSDDRQNDTAEFLCPELPNEEATQSHSDICCTIKCCYCSLFMTLDLLFGAHKVRNRRMTTSMAERGEKTGLDVAIISKISANRGLMCSSLRHSNSPNQSHILFSAGKSHVKVWTNNTKTPT